MNNFFQFFLIDFSSNLTKKTPLIPIIIKMLYIRSRISSTTTELLAHSVAVITIIWYLFIEIERAIGMIKNLFTITL